MKLKLSLDKSIPILNLTWKNAYRNKSSVERQEIPQKSFFKGLDFLMNSLFFLFYFFLVKHYALLTAHCSLLTAQPHLQVCTWIETWHFTSFEGLRNKMYFRSVLVVELHQFTASVWKLFFLLFLLFFFYAACTGGWENSQNFCKPNAFHRILIKLLHNML